MGYSLEKIIDFVFSSLGLSKKYELVFVVGLLCAILLLDYYTFPKNRKRTFEVIDRKRAYIWLGLIILSFSLLYYVLINKSMIISICVIISILWFYFFYFNGKTIWHSIGQLNVYNIGGDDSHVLIILSMITFIVFLLLVYVVIIYYTIFTA
jgi:hypothetical protein